MKTFILFSLIGIALAQECAPDEFRCPVSGVCIPQDRVCDGNFDCSRGEEEASPYCPCDGFKCPYPDYTCLPQEKVCDGIADCLNAEEEQECGCWFCKTGECYSEDDVCDGIRDCPGGEDEIDCPCNTDDKFKCEDGLCLPKDWVCDGYNDCVTGEDESNCNNLKMQSNRVHVHPKTKKHSPHQKKKQRIVKSKTGNRRLLPSLLKKSNRH